MIPGKRYDNIKLFHLKYCVHYILEELLLVSFSKQLTWKLSELLPLLQPVGYHGDEVVVKETSSCWVAKETRHLTQSLQKNEGPY